MTEIVEIDRIEDLAPLRGVWHELLRETPGASFFHSLEWLETYWRDFGHDQTLRVLVVSNGDRTVGILPLVVRRERRKFMQVRVLTYPLDDWGWQYGPIGPEPEAVLHAGLDYLRRRLCDWDLLDLRWVDPNGPVYEVTGQTLSDAHWKAYPSVRATTGQVELAGTFDDYLASRTGKWRSNWRRWQRRAAKQGELRLQRYRPLGENDDDGDPRWDLYDTCVRLARASWQGESTTGTTLSHDSVHGFLREAHAAAASLGMADMNVLRLDDRPVAYAYNYHHRGTVLGLRAGFDPAYRRIGVGVLLFMAIIEDAFRRGDRLYDMGPGSLDAKKGYLTRTIDVWQFTHFRPWAPRGQIVRLKQLARRYFTPSGPVALRAPWQHSDKPSTT